jgi:hypothetical protein
MGLAQRVEEVGFLGYWASKPILEQKVTKKKGIKRKKTISEKEKISD